MGLPLQRAAAGRAAARFALCEAFADAAQKFAVAAAFYVTAGTS